MYRITHFFKTYYPNSQGGLEEAIRQIGKHTLKAGYQVKVVSVSHYPFEGELEGIRCKSYLHSFGSPSMPFSISFIRNFRKEVANADIIHLQFPWPLAEALCLLFFIRKPIVITFHCDIHSHKILRAFYSPFLKILLKKTRIIIPTSENLMNNSVLLSEFRHKTKVIPLWMDEGRFSALPEPDDSFKTWVMNWGGFCLFVGVLRWYKGLEYLLEAAKSITGNVVIVGKGPLYEPLRSKVEKEEIHNVRLLGYLPDEYVKYLLQNCRFLVLPSISPAEAFGQILIEASFFRKPMVTTELGTGTSYVNINNHTGFVIEPKNARVLSEKCNQLFENNSLIQEFGENARKRYLDNFTEEIQGPKYIEVYDKILRSKTP